jgi:glucoamylase
VPDALEGWLEAQTTASLRGLRAGISATHLVKRRPGFGQVIVPARGSVLASTVLDSSDDEPDYFFHWLRDSALSMDLVATLAAERPDQGWSCLFDEFVDFSLSLAALDGRAVPTAETAPDHRRFLRPTEELGAVTAETVLGDVRFNPDGTIDPQRWGRPQYDGPALRALACLRHSARGGARSEALERLIRLDLDFTRRQAGVPCVDLWEESSGRHYYTLLAQYGALVAGAGWSGADPERAAGYAAAAATLRRTLAEFAAADGTYRPSLDTRPEKALDSCVILAALHVGLAGGDHSVDDPRLQATLAALERQFEAAYPINQRRRPGRGVAMGRYIGDQYLGRGPWYLCTFAAAEFRYRQAAAAADPARARALIAAGDASLRQASWTVPPSGELSEQFSPADGAQLSARQLGWSHAAFLTAAIARRAAVAPRANLTK